MHIEDESHLVTHVIQDIIDGDRMDDHIEHIKCFLMIVPWRIKIL